jgi:anti-sigma regulatory factor (Ser/Thr protein kinase)/anti-anti-sigma regulatory factor
MTVGIVVSNESIRLVGEFHIGDFRRVLVTLNDVAQQQHQHARGLPEKQRQPLLQIDFTQCRFAAPAAMSAFVAEITKLRREGVDFSLRLPSDTVLRNVFIQVGWAHYIEPSRFPVPPVSESSQAPLLQFESDNEQGDVVNVLVDHLLKSTSSLARKDFSAVEWAINEITDNVLHHASSPVGGFVYLSISEEANGPPDGSNRVDVVVADAGLGIPRTLRTAVVPVRDDRDMLDLAIREGVKGEASVGQGNGLYGSYRIAEGSGGSFMVHTGYAALESSRGVFDLHSERIEHNGTLIISSMDYTQGNVLADALRFHQPYASLTDYIEIRYEMEGTDETGVLEFDLSKEAESLGTRGAGQRVRSKLLNLHRMARGVKAVAVDLTNVAMISSSFADEVFGRLYLEFGPTDFKRVFQLVGPNPTVEALINRAIRQRSGDVSKK